MSEADLRSLESLLGQFVQEGVQPTPRLRELFVPLIELMADQEILKDRGYFTLDQACTRICDILHAAQIPRVKTFEHCGQEHNYHALQCLVRCPICELYRAKTHHFFAEDDIETVASSVLHWLGIEHESIPGWNASCDGWKS